MRKTLALSVLLALRALMPASASAQSPTYEVTIEASFGGTFPECMRFDFRSGTLTMDGLPFPLTLAFGDLNTDRSRFKAVTRGSTDSEIMFFGKFQNFGRLKAEGLQHAGNTFIISGVRNDSCPAAISSSRNWSPR